MKEFKCTHFNGSSRKIVFDEAEKNPVRIVTGASRHKKRKPLVLMTEEHYFALKLIESLVNKE